MRGEKSFLYGKSSANQVIFLNFLSLCLFLFSMYSVLKLGGDSCDEPRPVSGLIFSRCYFKNIKSFNGHKSYIGSTRLWAI